MSQTATFETSLYLRRDMEEPEYTKLPSGEVVVFSSRCPGKTSDNEDAALVVSASDAGDVLAVADGMGGGAAGEEASQLAVDAVQKAVRAATQSGDALRTAILNGIEQANETILGLGVGAATTIAVVEIVDGVIRPYHVGDSSILVVGQRGKIKLETVAHSPVGQAVDAGVLDHREALHHEDRHLVSNMLGTQQMRIEIGPTHRLACYDTVLLASDGLFDNFTTDEVVARIRKGPLLECVSKLVESTHGRMKNSPDGVPSKPDDLTVIGFRRGRR